MTPVLHSTYFIRPPCFTPHVYRSSHWFSNYQNWFTIAPRCARAAGRPKLEAGQNQSKAMFCRASERASERVSSPLLSASTRADGRWLRFFPKFSIRPKITNSNSFHSPIKRPKPLPPPWKSGHHISQRRRRRERARTTTTRSGAAGTEEGGRPTSQG